MTQDDSQKDHQVDDIYKILNLKRKISASTKWAMGLTGVWAVVVFTLASVKWPEFAEMPPNAWGDFLAGTFSPLALLWLVAGYRQQGDELFLNTKALLMQQVEMKNQVAEFKKLAIHAEEQSAASAAMLRFNQEEREARESAAIQAIQPKFKFDLSYMTDSEGLQFKIINQGEEAHLVELQCSAYEKIDYFFDHEFLAGSSYDVLFEGKLPDARHEDFTINAYYVDIRGVKRAQHYSVRGGVSYLTMGWAVV